MRKLPFFLLGLTIRTFAQAPLDETDQKLLNWHNKDMATDTVVGISTEKAYNELLTARKSTTVVVAIIDSGVDIDHEDLNDNVWVNEDEIPGNGIDDDKNGYIDDRNGWSFLGNPKGENINQETLEMTRICKKYGPKYEKIKPEEVAPADKSEYEQYTRARKEYVQKVAEAKSEEASLQAFLKKYNQNDSIVRNFLKKDTFSLEDLTTVQTEDEKVKSAVQMISFLKESGFQRSDIKKYLDHIDSKLNYHLNLDYNPRTIIGDDPYVWDGKPYGSNDVKGPDCEHGTHVAGIVAAERKNSQGMDGIAANVKIMSVRAVPDGDERDKDIAMAIRYAVDNGAQIVNMSFGKAYSPQKQWVDDAVRYAEQKGVLLVHAAGNDSKNTDEEPSFPSARYLQSKDHATNWLSIGANTTQRDATLPAFFSNYGKKTVDIFAPGHEIYSLKPNNRYATNSGTSMAAPMVTGLAALIKSYYPALSPQQLIAIILESGTDFKKVKVSVPGGKKKTAKTKTAKFKKLSRTGKVINAYQALKLAEERSKKAN